MTLANQLIFLYPIFSSKLKIFPRMLQRALRSRGERYIINPEH